MTPVSVLAVMVNYRTPELAIDAILSLRDEVVARGDTHVVVVDNASGDGSAAAIAAAIAAHGFGAWCTLHALARNGGFSAGNNEGLRWYLDAAGGALPDHVWLINPDTLAQPDAIGGLVRFMDTHPKAGIVGGRCLWPDGAVRNSAFRFHTWTTELIEAANFGLVTRLLGGGQVAVTPRDEPIEVDWVSGSSLMIRRAVIETIGPMDEGYFLYFEESDYCSQAAAAGFEIWTVPDSIIYHIGGQATGVTGPDQVKKRRPRYWFESRARFFLRRYGVATTHVANLAWLAAFPFGRLIGTLRGRSRSDPPRLWRDFATHYYGPGGIMYHSREIGDPARIAIPA